MLIGTTIARPVRPDDLTTVDPDERGGYFVDPNADQRGGAFIDPAPSPVEDFFNPIISYFTSTPQPSGPAVPDSYFSTRKTSASTPPTAATKTPPTAATKTAAPLIKERAPESPSSPARSHSAQPQAQNAFAQLKPLLLPRTGFSIQPAKKIPTAVIVGVASVAILAAAYFIFKE